MNIISNVFRILLGIVFVFSGFVKVVDPVGVKYKFVDYFLAMGLEFLEPTALTFGLLLSVAELMIGISLLFNLRPKLGAWGTLLFMTVFLPLTLWIAIVNPVQDCGCFGDALILSNWATFWKNVVIMLMTIVVFLKRKSFNPTLPAYVQWASIVVVAALTFWLGIYSYHHLPVLDFRPYRIGENISEGMQIPESEKNNQPEYEITLIYENLETAELKEFDINDIPEGDNWEWRETKSKMIKEGYVPPIHDFSITTVPLVIDKVQNDEIISPAMLYDVVYQFEMDGDVHEFYVDQLPGSEWSFVDIVSDNNIKAENIALLYEREGETNEFTLFDLPDDSWSFVDAMYYNSEPEAVTVETPEDITDIVLADPDYSFLLVTYDISMIEPKHFEKINELSEFAEINDYSFLCLTASSEEDIKAFVEASNSQFNFFNTDPITLKTIVRSNPGLVLIKEGTVLNKWHFNDFPSVEELQSQLMAASIEKQVKRAERNYIFMLIFGLFFAFTALFLLIQYLLRKRILVDRETWN
jgi:uncharacterized membrane protein YphA (DoxX/SURF4 family)